MASLTVHCIVKNEENFVGFAIESVVSVADTVLVFDTGSTDATVAIIEALVRKYPTKIKFEQKGPCDKRQHTELRQEMITKTTTEWFMILDGDEIWTKRGVVEMKRIIDENSDTACLIAPFYLCVGDVFHTYYGAGDFSILGRTGFFSPRVIKKINGVHWQGDYNYDALVLANGDSIVTEATTHFLHERYWHVSHLRRSSSDDTDYSSGGSRRSKQRLTYFWIGRSINEPVPEVFTEEFKQKNKLSGVRSVGNFVRLVGRKMTGIFS